MTGIDKVIAAAGGQTALAEVLPDCTQQAVSKWQKRGYVPAARVELLARTFNVPREELIDPALRQLVQGE